MASTSQNSPACKILSPGRRGDSDPRLGGIANNDDGPSVSVTTSSLWPSSVRKDQDPSWERFATKWSASR
eukprot:CAMPEP_0204356792 /NCGR_PEP_ID=MMETSP0469-20131031/35208_1 /ASSEMBLY_ACC=CAM_ASM_000384 /TAXON_ID=2969 /ORGANISM="Oxyrrhis marina" /LENGTH=69 /DNA_ID=CAMNT_0051344311 /DNA_START=133 /DNA_END=342 /DNA_ORIENTATION=+